MRHNRLEARDVAVVERLAVRRPLETDHGEAAVAWRKRAAETFLEADRAEELGEEHARMQRFVGQQPVGASGRAGLLRHERGRSRIKRLVLTLVKFERLPT